MDLNKNNFFEDLSEILASKKDSEISKLILGWHASYIFANDGRYGVGFVPDSRIEPHTARQVHTENLLNSSLQKLAKLYFSPFPQEFAAASAACSILIPFDKNSGMPLDAVMPCARGDKVAVLGYERDLVPFMFEWGWRVAIFDDRFSDRQNCFPQDEFSRGVREAEWVWLSPEAIRDRWLLSTQNILREKKGCFLQGPGIPFTPKLFLKMGITHLLTPICNENFNSIEADISAGSSTWLCDDLTWKVYLTRKTVAKSEFM